MSANKIVLALDGMGGDHAPQVVVNGADIARERYPGTTFLLFGDPARLKPLVDKRKGLAEVLEIVPAEDAVLAEDKPSFALRRRRKSSMWLAIEGTAKLYTQFVRDAFRTSTFAKIGYLFASGAWVKLRKRVDPRRYNGGVFLGLDGVCVKSHGGTDALGFAYAIGVAVDLVRYEYKSKLIEGLAKLRQVTSAADAPTEAL